tara:strand:+ start:87376 stop:88005 length:630 start_codon:yes stop_codon:yes gene_type:complete
MNSWRLRARDAAEAIDIPLEEWHGNCFAIAVAILKAGLVEGEAVYGVYQGPISADGFWADRRKLAGTIGVHHGWIDLRNGQILDPTRWSFENVEPYIHETRRDDEEYDAYGMRLRSQLQQPCPTKKPCDQIKSLDLSEGARATVCTLMGRENEIGSNGDMSVSQVFWLANLDPQLLGEYAVEIYNAITNANFGAFIPIDSDQFVRGGRY